MSHININLRPCFSILNTSGRQNVRTSEQRKPLTSPVGRHLISGTYRRTQQIEQHTCLILCLRTLVTQVLIANTLSFRSRTCWHIVARRRGGTRTSIRGLDIGVFHETPGSRVGTRTRTAPLGRGWARGATEMARNCGTQRRAHLRRHPPAGPRASRGGGCDNHSSAR